MPFVLPADPVSGQVAPVSWGDDVRAALNYLANPPACDLTHSTTASIGNSAWTPQPFDTENEDPSGLHSNVTNNSRITIVDTGRYVFVGGIVYASNATGARGLGFRRNGSGVGAGPTHGGLIIPAASGVGTYVAVSRSVKMTAGQWMELICFQTSGGALNSVGPTDGMPFFGAVWVGLG